jgi:hypothetical protein
VGVITPESAQIKTVITSSKEKINPAQQRKGTTTTKTISNFSR